MSLRVFLFGEAEKGEMCSPLRLENLVDLAERLGNPPSDSIGIDYAVQTLLFKHELIYYRIAEEGFSHADYMRGVKLLYNYGRKMHLSAICLPGVGDRRIIESLGPICQQINALLVLTEKDLYDYLTGSKY